MAIYDLPATIQSKDDFIKALPKVNDRYQFMPDNGDVVIFWTDETEEVSFRLLVSTRQVEIPDGFLSERLTRLQAAFSSFRQKKARTKLRERIQTLVADLDGAAVSDLALADLRLLVLMLAFRDSWIVEDEAGDLVVSIPDRWWR